MTQRQPAEQDARAAGDGAGAPGTPGTPGATNGPDGPGATGHSPFLAILSRLKYIDRWALMRNARAENLAEHSLEVAMVAHVLATIANVRHGARLDADRAAVLGLFHDASETLTGDMPTPVKYANGRIRDAYKDVEATACAELLETLPADLRAAYAPVIAPAAPGTAGTDATAAGDGARTGAPAAPAAPDGDRRLLLLVKAADKISALVKCLDEAQAGNAEFRTAEASTRAAVERMAADLPEVADFVAEFLPPYGSTLDELMGR